MINLSTRSGQAHRPQVLSDCGNECEHHSHGAKDTCKLPPSLRGAWEVQDTPTTRIVPRSGARWRGDGRDPAPGDHAPSGVAFHRSMTGVPG